MSVYESKPELMVLVGCSLGVGVEERIQGSFVKRYRQHERDHFRH